MAAMLLLQPAPAHSIHSIYTLLWHFKPLRIILHMI